MLAHKFPGENQVGRKNFGRARLRPGRPTGPAKHTLLRPGCTGSRREVHLSANALARMIPRPPGRSYGPPPNSVRVCYAALCLHTRLCGLCPTRVSFGARRESSRATTVRAGASKPTEMGRGDLKWLFKNKVSIQLQVPLQLPCYNFIRITLHRFEEYAVLTYVLNDGSSPSTA